jgi:tripartite-type tricarboxylate transporter receptor subunit TctC
MRTCSGCSRRAALGWLAAGCGGSLARDPVPWPSGPVTLVVGAPAGGVVDLFARALADVLGPLWHQRVLVDNRPGASGLIGARAVAQAVPGSHVVACIHSGLVTLQALDEAGGPLNALRPVAKMSRSALAVVVRDAAPYRSLAELVGAVQARPGQLKYSSAGFGSPAHMAVMRLAATVAPFDAIHVPYKGSPEADVAVVTGEVDFHVGPIGAALPFIRSGQSRALALTGRQRAPSLPDVMTAAQAGVPDLVIEPWVGLAMPTSTPAAVVDTLSQAVRHALGASAVRERMRLLAAVIDYADPVAFAAQLEAELDTERRLLKRLGPAPPR